MRSEDLPNELDRKHAQRDERRKRAITYIRKRAWMWGTACDRNRGIPNFDKHNEEEFQYGKQRDD